MIPVITILRVAPLLACIALTCVDCYNTVFAQIPLPSPQVYNLSLEGKTYPVEYNIARGNVMGIALNGLLGMMTIRVISTTDGPFGITFPRELMTDIFRHGNGLDDVYYPSEVFLDSVPVSAEIFANCESVHYVIPLTAGTSEIGFVREINPEDPHAVLGQSSHEPYSFFFTSNYMPREYYTIGVTTNAENCSISLIQRDARLQFNLTSSSGSQTEIALVLPHSVLGGNYTVLLDAIPVSNYTTVFVPAGRYHPQIQGDATLISLSYPSEPGKQRIVEIIGKSAIPEFQATIAAPICAGIAISILLLARWRALKPHSPPR